MECPYKQEWKGETVVTGFVDAGDRTKAKEAMEMALNRYPARKTLDELRHEDGPKPVLPINPEARKGIPIFTGVLDYFPAFTPAW